MCDNFLYLNEITVSELLDWDKTFAAVEVAMKSVSTDKAVQNPRDITKVGSNALLTMPGYVNDDEYGALGCKIVTAWPGNPKRQPPLPTIAANIFLFDENTGLIKAGISGTEITSWRTATASAVATKYIHLRKKSSKFETLAILGAGVQGRIHAIAFYHFFKDYIKEIRIWNHTPSRAATLVEELKDLLDGVEVKAVTDNEECVKGADVIVTATTATEPILKEEWLTAGTHINAVGAGLTHHSELEEAVYQRAEVYIDHWAGARQELKGLIDNNVQINGEVGQLIAGDLQPPSDEAVTVFQSLGMASEDCTVARMVYDLYIEKYSS